VLEASEKAGGAAVAVDSRMVDRPVILRAQALLRQGNGIAQPPVRTTTGDKP
jgi:citrate lyase subunit beta/citryl-CoA lyase